GRTATTGGTSSTCWHTGVLRQLGTVVFDLPEMLKATAGAVILLAVGVTSARAARRRMRYETWYHLHLLTYAAVFLAFAHQLALGADFVSAPPARAAWYTLYLCVACLVLYYRVLTPARLNLRHRIRVEAVVPEAPGVYSVWLRGRRLDRLGARPGQFLR
ncbi:ferric reductase-like transmembrane domain-containing protein, partial [Streptomyces sp. C1-2]|uniref:ferric reductase-like transmembrane domain-containing protein n=1 Tax=Streptomyces sp. C1-2 TaxID=2720022 RepID=UPI0016B26A3D